MHEQYQFYLIGLMEPMQNANKLEGYKRKLGLQHAFANVSIIKFETLWMKLMKFHSCLTWNNIGHIGYLIRKLKKDFIITLVYAKGDIVERVEL